MSPPAGNVALGASQVSMDVLDVDRLRTGRTKRGECPTCGMKLFKISGNQLLANTSKRKQTPLLCKNGKTVSGRCLMCFPLEAEEQEEHCAPVPKVLICETRGDGDGDSSISEITLDRRLLQLDNDFLSAGKHLQSSRTSDDLSKVISCASLTKASRLSKASQFDDESLTESDNDDDGPRRISPQHKSARSMNNSSHHNVVSLSSSCRNRWGESVAGDTDMSTGPRPLPPKRVPSSDGDKNQSFHHSLPSRVTTPTTCNTTDEGSPNQRVVSTHQRSASPSRQSARILIPNSPAKKSNFTPPWNPRSQANETFNARKPGDTGKPVDEKRVDNSCLDVSVSRKDIFFTSGNLGGEAEEKRDVDEGTPIASNSRRMSTSRGNEFAKQTNSRHDGTPIKEITLFGINNAGLKPAPDFDEKGDNNYDSANDLVKVSRHMRGSVNMKDIHVDLTSIAEQSVRRISSPAKGDVTPRTLKRQKALNMLVQMEHVFPTEHVTSAKPPKKIQRAISIEPTGANFAKELKQKERRRSQARSILSIGELTAEELNIEHSSIKNLLSSISNIESRERRIDILRYMAGMMWMPDSAEARTQFMEENGMEVLTTILWTEMMHPNIQIAGLKLLFALASGPSDSLGSHVVPLAGDGTDVIIDALLITMEQHASVEELQLLGCQVLCSLSSELSSSADVNDGTRSGACIAILTAMEAHRDAAALQEWGVRTLYNQCVHSKHADTNKRTILSSKLEHSLCLDGSGRAVGGAEVLYRVLKSSIKSRNQGFMLEWTCKLYKSLTASVAIAEMLSASDLMKSFLSLVRRCGNEGETEALSFDVIEASLSSISNLLNIDHNKACVDASEVLHLLLDLMTSKKGNLGIVLPCCSILSKLASEPSVRKDTIPILRAVRRVIDAMMDFPDSRILVDTCLRVLACLSLGSDVIKEQLCDRGSLDRLIALCKRSIAATDEISTIEENTCTLIASLFSNERLQARALQCDTLDVLRKSMERSRNNVELQEIAVVALMNLSTGVNVDFLAQGNTVELIVSAMEYNTSSVVVQKNACCALWNIGVKTESGMNRLLEANAIKCIVRAIQNHLDNDSVVEMACGCLWGLADSSDSFKNHLLKVDGAMETTAWTLVVFSNFPSLQEKSCGVLATVSSSVCESNADVAATCITNLVDAIRSNPQSLPVLQSGARFLNQVLLHVPNHADEACEVVSVYISAMKECGSSPAFQQDACDLLRTIAEKSPAAKERILKMDGMSVLMDILDTSRGDENVETAALGAFKELALTSTRNE